MRGTGFARQPYFQGLPLTGRGLRRALGLSLLQDLLFRETNLDEALPQKVLWRYLLVQGCERLVRLRVQAWRRLAQFARVLLRAEQALNPK